MGLAKLAIEGQARRQIQKLTQTYLTLRWVNAAVAGLCACMHAFGCPHCGHWFRIPALPAQPQVPTPSCPAMHACDAAWLTWRSRRGWAARRRLSWRCCA